MTRTLVRLTLAACAASLLAAPALAAKPPRTSGQRAAAGDTQMHGIAIGAAMPAADAPLLDVDGRTITLAGSVGRKGTLVLFICNHCPWVKAWQPRIAAVGNAALGKGIGVVAVNANDPAAYPEDAFDVMVTRAKEVGYRFAYAADTTSATAIAFGATHTPEAFLFDAKGKLVYHGAVDDNAQEPENVRDRWLANAVDAVAAGKPVATAESKALGCTIKFRGAGAAH